LYIGRSEFEPPTMVETMQFIRTKSR
jgi:hypothetical protein